MGHGGRRGSLLTRCAGGIGIAARPALSRARTPARAPARSRARRRALARGQGGRTRGQRYDQRHQPAEQDVNALARRQAARHVPHHSDILWNQLQHTEAPFRCLSIGWKRILASWMFWAFRALAEALPALCSAPPHPDLLPRPNAGSSKRPAMTIPAYTRDVERARWIVLWWHVAIRPSASAVITAA